MNGTQGRPVLYLTKHASYHYFYFIESSAIHQFLLSLGYTDPESIHFLNTHCFPDGYISFHKGARFISRIRRSLPSILFILVNLLSTFQLFHTRRYVQSRRITPRLLSRKRKSPKRKLVLPSPIPPTVAPKIFSPTHAIFIPHFHSPPDVFPLIPPVLQAYCHSPILSFPRAGVG